MDHLCRMLLILAVLFTAFTLGVLAMQFPLQFFLSGTLGFVWAVSRGKQKPTSDVHGTAQWCSEKQARKAGML
jgi:hypothetical protein